jgi:hypothetical protein
MESKSLISSSTEYGSSEASHSPSPCETQARCLASRYCQPSGPQGSGVEIRLPSCTNIRLTLLIAPFSISMSASCSHGQCIVKVSAHKPQRGVLAASTAVSTAPFHTPAVHIPSALPGPRESLKTDRGVPHHLLSHGRIPRLLGCTLAIRAVAQLVLPRSESLLELDLERQGSRA